MYHVAMVVQVIWWDIVTQLLTKKGKNTGVQNFLFWKLHNKNAKIGVLEDLENKIFFAIQPRLAELPGKSQK